MRSPLRWTTVRTTALASCLLLSASSTWAQQPQSKAATIGGFSIVGNSIVSAQQMFLGTETRVYIVDKTENNPTQINGHPAWAAEYATDTNQGRPMDIITNSFCAGGNVLGNGTWVNVGGNQAITYGGLQAASQTGGAPYDDPDGGQSIRLLDPCDDGSCDWQVHSDNAMSTRRWYPSVETLPDGSVIIIGGDDWGGFVNSADQNNPTYEFFPTQGAPIQLDILTTTLPVNLFPITFLMPSGVLFMQLNWATVMFDYVNGVTTNLDNVPDAVRTYPASAGTAILPMTPANNWTATVVMCGGTNLQSDQWTEDWDIAVYPASSSCVRITPDQSSSYTEDDALPEGRVMLSFVLLPNGKILGVNGANTGVAGYDNVSWAIGQSFADNPVLSPLMYDPSQPSGSRWVNDGLTASTVPRMYHSGAMLIADGSVLVSGSNPNADFTTGVKYSTEYRVEYFYPEYYNSQRPEPQGLPTTLTYGGAYFNVTLNATDLSNNMTNLANAQVVVIRTGFSTHALSMGQRFVQLNNTYTGNSDGSGVLHVSQMPPNAAILAPGPALIFVVVDGVPSIGKMVMVGNGQLGQQTMSAVVDLPPQSLPSKSDNTTDSSNSNNGNKNSSHGRDSSLVSSGTIVLLGVVSALVSALW
ncbi:glyoxal oxidase [Schizopora paradoxa]|uniref:Glyoxal oxidase n=1 Tax=Schizopora paradoxa TaxID=27342 RepID=A0A0H2RS58_9AGAM|nr:glyoxal oxidase [Schizopora paradoxa]